MPGLRTPAGSLGDGWREKTLLQGIIFNLHIYICIRLFLI